MTAYVAGRRLKVGEGFIEPGEPVPGAEQWPSFIGLLSSGFLVEVEGSDLAPLPSTSEVNWNKSMSKAELVAVADENGIDSSGTKKDIIARLP